MLAEVRKGSAEVLILNAIEGRERHGYDIARFIDCLLYTSPSPRDS